MADGKFSKLLFKPSVRRSLERGEARVAGVTLAGSETESSEGFHFASGTFRYDPPGVPLKNVQQLNIDFSKFEKHTFFNSAEAKTQAAFDKIINQFPFDGTKKDLIEFRDNLNGYDSYVLSRWPKYTGFLQFNSASYGADPDKDHYGAGSHIKINDYKSATGYVAKKSTGESLLDPTGKNFTVEFYINPATANNHNEVIFQRRGENTSAAAKSKHFGITIALSESNSTTDGTIHAFLSSGSFGVNTSTKIKKGAWSHFAFVFSVLDDNLKIFKNGELITSSSVGSFGVGSVTSPVTIASGALHQTNTFNFEPTMTFSGSLDELRFWHSARSLKQIRAFHSKNVFAEDDLKLYLRFNEPSGAFGTTGRAGNESLILDHSGNGFHVAVTNFDMSQRNTGSIKSPITQEDSADSPVLFPSYRPILDLNNDLMQSASEYDYNNPNLITKLIPKHYLLEAAQQEGFAFLSDTGGDYLQEKGDIGNAYDYYSDQPGAGKLGSPQIISALLYVMAAEMDELKLFVGELGRLLKVDHTNADTISDQFLPFLAKYYGLNLPSAFANASIRQLRESNGITLDKVMSNLGLQQIQNTIWRRILADLPELMRSRGTRHSIESLLRDIGIQPNGLFRIREYGGSRRKNISDTFEKRHEIASMLDFSGSFSTAGTLDGSGVDSSRPLLRTNALRAQRVEPGKPTPGGTFVNGISNSSRDELLTSGSWAIESVVKFEGHRHLKYKQSLFRVQTTGSQVDGSANNFLLFNVVATPPVTSSATTGSITFWGRPTSGSNGDVLKMILTGVNVFDGNKWHVSVGRTRNDFAGSRITSSYYFRAGKMSAGRLVEYHSDTKGLVDTALSNSGRTALNFITSSNNASGAFLVVGSQSLTYDRSTAGLAGMGHLNSYWDNDAKIVNFTGKTSGLRFFSKDLSEKETLAHIKNFKSVGVENPMLNFSFNTADSGSFERLRANLSIDQPLTKSNASGNIKLFDFSQNHFHASGSGFEASTQIIKPERFDYEILSPRFELAVATNKVRVRSWKDYRNINKYGGDLAPMYEIPQMDQPNDDRRLAVEVSCVQALNEDIINIFATLESFDTMLGAPELVFAHEYRDLRNLRKVYFNRLQNELSLEKFFRFYKWFDDTVGDILEELLPSSTNYLGTNFIIESHALERAKFVYNYFDMYIGEIERLEIGTIYLQQYLASIRKF